MGTGPRPPSLPMEGASKPAPLPVTPFAMKLSHSCKYIPAGTDQSAEVLGCLAPGNAHSGQVFMQHATQTASTWLSITL